MLACVREIRQMPLPREIVDIAPRTRERTVLINDLSDLVGSEVDTHKLGAFGQWVVNEVGAAGTATPANASNMWRTELFGPR